MAGTTKATNTSNTAGSSVGRVAAGPDQSSVFGSVGRVRVIAVVWVVFGLVWAIDATLKWLPAFAQNSFIGTLQGARLGQSSAVQGWINLWLNVLQGEPMLYARLLAVAESLLALCLLVGAFTNIACVLGGLLSLAIWTTAEGFGGPYVAGGNDIGASIIYVLVFVVLVASAAGSQWGLDSWLRPRLGRFGWLCSPVLDGRWAQHVL